MNAQAHVSPLAAARDVGADIPRAGEVPAHHDTGGLHTTRRIVVIGYTAGCPTRLCARCWVGRRGRAPSLRGLLSRS